MWAMPIVKVPKCKVCLHALDRASVSAPIRLRQKTSHYVAAAINNANHACDIFTGYVAIDDQIGGDNPYPDKWAYLSKRSPYLRATLEPASWARRAEIRDMSSSATSETITRAINPSMRLSEPHCAP